MKFQEPRVEFVHIDLADVVATSPVCDQQNSKKGSVETCTGPDAPGNKCCDGTNAFSV